MPRKLKFLSLLITVSLLTGCGEGGDGIFENLDGNGKLIYLGILLCLAVLALVAKLIIKIIRPGSKQQQQPSSQPHSIQPIASTQPIPATPTAIIQQSAMPPPPSVEMINELSKPEPQKETV